MRARHANKILWLLISVGCADSALSAPDPISKDEITVDASDRELKKIASRLQDLHQQVNAVPRTSTAPGLGPQLITAQRAYDIGTEAFKQKQWLSAIQEIQTFLTLSQKPEPRAWLKAQYMLGRAYEEQGQNQRAARAYTRYLATFTTRPTQDYAELTEIFERLVRLATKGNEAKHGELSQFLSAISTLEFPSAVSEELRYLTAVAGNNIGRKNLSLGWLSEVDERSSAPETKARSRYFRSLIAIASSQWSDAADQLESLLQLDGISAKTKDNARISLARIYLKVKKPESALQTYNQIAEGSDVYRDASYEKVFVLIKLQKDDEARSLAHNWLSKYGDHNDATQLRVIASWLDLRAGDLNAAKSSIDGTIERLSAIQKQITEDFKSSKLSHNDAAKLAAVTRGQVVSSPELDHIISMFRQLGELNVRLAEIDGIERSLVYSIGKSDLRTFRPALASRLEQYDRLTDAVLAEGNKIAYLDRERLRDRLSDVDKQKLEASERRRKALFERQSQLARQSKRWATWLAPAEQLVKLAEKWERLNKAEATAMSTPAKTKTDESDIQNASRKISDIRAEMLATLTEIRMTQAGNIVEQSAMNDSIYILQQYASSLHEESKILATYEPTSGKILDSLDDDDSRVAWNLWLETVASLNGNIRKLRKEAANDLSTTLSSIVAVDQQRAQMARDVNQLRAVLESYGGESLAGIVSHYNNAITQRIARQYKWSGDLEYLNYSREKNSHDSMRRKKDLEIQILNDQLRDLEQGGATQWPR